MRTVPFQKILERCARKCGVIPGSADYTNEFMELLADGINEGLAYAWRAHRWPDACAIEERQFAADYAAGTTYATGDFVLDSDQYWVSLQDSNTGHTPAAGSAYWEVSSDYDLYIAREQAWETNEIGEFLGITQLDPRRSTVPYSYDFTVDADGAWLTSNCSATTIYVRYRKPVPRFGWQEWDADEDWFEGDLVIGSDGECYRALADQEVGVDGIVDPTDPASAATWQKVQFPESFERFALHWARAWCLRDDGQDDKAAAEEEMAEGALQALSLEVFGGQQQDVTVRMKGYGV